MKAVIVGTAGHIDHGKSALVRALTGTDPDRLEEEKRRGITIDIGFANLDLAGAAGEKLRLGFVDVPGHERFVRNMLAGIGGIDLVLLVIAADESVKPQTREHFDICRLLSVQRGITVLTKSDLVDGETLEVVRMEVAEYLQGSFLDPAHAPIVAVSSKTGVGLEELRHELARLAAEVPVKDIGATFRLPIDRVFAMKGFGTVVTGTLISGSVRKDEELEVHPTGQRLRVRGVQVHGTAAEEAIAGQRTALNLVGAETSELARGMMLTRAGLFRPTRRVSVKLNLLPSAKLLRDGARVHLHAFTAETIAKVSVLGAKHLQPGQTGLARLKLDDAVMLLPGDRFIVRQFSPVITIGGGVVLDALESARRVKAAERLAFVQTMAAANESEALWARVSRQGFDGLTLVEAVAETGWLRERVDSLAAELVAARKILRFGEVLVSAESVGRIRAEMKTTVEAFHQANRLVAGISREELREKVGVGPDVFRGVEELLVRDQQLVIAGELVHAAGRGVVLRDDEAESKKQIEAAFANAGLKVPLLKDVLAALPVDKVRAQKIVTLLLRDRVLVKVGDDLVFHRAALDGLRKLVVAQKTATPKINVVAFKDLIGVTRKYAIPLLEWLDRERVTRRVGDERVIL
ncbi:MAG TPA: selenocysteine-specific translation elongation factor [Candidatus Angelobacter sp.]|nr:selenocysteine-specific translation elongation factor [Candidatus Angelobacter sp.]